MRKDLPIGLLAAQVVHAAGESSDRVPPGTYAVVLSVPDEQHLLKVEKYLKDKGITHTAIRENGHALQGELTAIGIEPRKRSELFRHFSSLPLLR